MYFGAQLWNIREILRVMGEILLLGVAYMGSEISETNYFKKDLKDRNDEKKLLVPCNAFKCEPYFAVVVDGPSAGIRGCLISYKKVKKENPILSTRVLNKTTEAFERYKKNKSIFTFQINLGQN